MVKYNVYEPHFLLYVPERYFFCGFSVLKVLIITDLEQKQKSA